MELSAKREAEYSALDDVGADHNPFLSKNLFFDSLKIVFPFYWKNDLTLLPQKYNINPAYRCIKENRKWRE